MGSPGGVSVDSPVEKRPSPQIRQTPLQDQPAPAMVSCVPRPPGEGLFPGPLPVAPLAWVPLVHCPVLEFLVGLV